MAKQFDEKLKLLYVLKILQEETDGEHRMYVPEIIKRLEKEGIKAERKSVYRDLETLEAFGFDIVHDRTGCALLSRDFELAELKLLVDAVQASRFITGDRQKELVAKLVSMTNRHQAKQLNRTVRAEEGDRVTNRSILVNIDWIHAAMADNKRITFQYFDWTPQKEQQLRHEGKRYEMSPWCLVWSNENYYMLAYDAKAEMVKHFRVDKLSRISYTDFAREGAKCFKNFDLGQYSNQVFGMFSGELDSVTLKCHNSLAGVIIDRFGEDVSIFPKDDHFLCSVNVMVSNNFFSWVMQFGKKMQIVSPEGVVDKMKALITEAGEMYK